MVPKWVDMRFATPGTCVEFLKTHPKQSMRVVQDALVCVAQDGVDAGGTARAASALSGVWTCDTCGVVKDTKQALAAHMFVAHKQRREAMRKLRATTCPVCGKKFGSRAALSAHVHGPIGKVNHHPICFVNIMLFYDDLPPDEVLEAEKRQTEEVRAASASGAHPAWSGKLVKQTEGPLRVFLIPANHSRQSRFPMLVKFLKDRRATPEADFDSLLELICTEADPDWHDEVPISMLPPIESELS